MHALALALNGIDVANRRRNDGRLAHARNKHRAAVQFRLGRATAATRAFGENAHAFAALQHGRCALDRRAVGGTALNGERPDARNHLARKAAGVGEHVVTRHEPHPLLRACGNPQKRWIEVGNMVANDHRAALAIELAQIFDAFDFVAEGDFKRDEDNRVHDVANEMPNAFRGALAFFYLFKPVNRVDGHIPHVFVCEKHAFLLCVRASSARHIADLLDDFVDRKTGGIDAFRIGGGNERRGLAGGIELIAPHDVGEHLVEIDGPNATSFVLRHAATRALFVACGKEHLDFGLREHDRANIAALDYVIALRADAALLIDECLTHFGVLRGGTHRPVDARRANVARHVNAIDEHLLRRWIARLMGKGNRTLARDFAQSDRILKGDAMLERIACDASVHRTCVEAVEAKRLRDRFGHSRLAGSRRAVNSNNHE